MEGNAYQTCLDSTLDILEDVYMRDQVGSYKGMMILEISLLKMFMWGLFYWEDLEYDWHLRFSFNTMMPKFSQLAQELGKDFNYALFHDQRVNLEVLIHDLEEAIKQFRQQVRDICNHLLGGAFKCTSTPSSPKKFGEYGRDTGSFIDLIQMNLRALQNSNLMAPVVKQQIALIQSRLGEFEMLVDHPNRLFDLIPCTRAWLNRISCLTYLYWIDGNDESLASAMESMLSVLLHKTLPCTTSGVISSHLQPTMIPQLLSHHLDFILEGLFIPVRDEIEILQEGLIFMLSFIMDTDHVDSEDREIIWVQVYAIINKFPSLIYLLHSNEMKEDICKASLSEIILKVDKVKEKVRELFVVIPYSSQFTSPNTNVIGFLTVLIENLKRMLEREVNWIPGLKDSCELLLMELVSFRPLLKTLVELQQDEEIKDLSREIVNMVYNVDYLTKLCLMGRFSSWYAVIALPNVRDSTKFIKNLINKLVEIDKLYNKKNLGHLDQMEETEASQPRGATFEAESITVGFNEVEKLIIDELTRGQNSLRIVSISGSGGQGKTTLAKKIFNDPNVQCHFLKSIWCYVSKDCPVKEVLVQILYPGTKRGGANEKRMEDLMEHVWKILKGRRYLIVMDDIWDIDAWGQLESSFPDDKNGSRILFTSRNQDLVSQVKSNSISHPLPLFYDEESWELMKKKVFGPNDFNEEFVGIGKKIASYCKGLPLAVALIAGVLRRTECNLDSWNKVAENMKTHLALEGCRNVLELSYKYLPDHLKSCFLYFAAFQRGEEVGAKNLKLLWIGEGFIIQDGETKFSEDLATEYLKDLVSQGLVVVTEMSSTGGIKRCNVHDLLYDLCLEKAKEDNFMLWSEKSSVQDIHSSTGLLNYNHHRLSISETDPFISSSPIVTDRQLPISPLHSYLWSVDYAFPSSEYSLRVLASFKIVTVLKLNHNSVTFPEMILSSIHLRHLELHSLSTVRAIPPTISSLWKLETFIIGSLGWNVTLLPLSLWSMKSLRYVIIVPSCLDFEGFNMKHSSKSDIETLGGLYLDEDDGTTAETLRIFPNLKRLKCQTLKRERHILDLLSIFGSLLTQLESLNVAHFGEADKCLYKKQPKSRVWNFGKIENLTKLTLSGIQIPWSVVSKIGKQLPNLRALKLLGGSCRGRSWKLKDGDFSNLMYLKLSFSLIREFDISSCDDLLPCLEHLVLENCRKLVEIPLAFGEINTLKTIRIAKCSTEAKASAMRVLEDQREFGNNSLQVIVK